MSSCSFGFLALLPLLALACAADKEGKTSASGDTTQASTSGGTSSNTSEGAMTASSGPKTGSTGAGPGTASSTTASDSAELCDAFAKHLVMCDPSESEREEQYKERCMADLQAAWDADGAACADALTALFECKTKAPCDSPGGDCIVEFGTFEAACPNLGGPNSTT